MSSTAGPSNQSYSERVGSGWATFVAIYLMIAGVLNAIWGLSALDNKSYFIHEGLLWSTLDTWGWIALILGIVQILGSLLVFSRHAAGAIIAAFLAFCGLMVNFLSIGAYPVWSVILIVTDALILWAVTVHGDEFVRD